MDKKLDRKQLGLIAAVGLAIATACAGMAMATASAEVVPGLPTISTEVVHEPEEDEPDFDCRIHGNRSCGPTTALV